MRKGDDFMRYVYLYELDSVKKTDEEVRAAQYALFDEIVCNGNGVVLSLNQLTDSKAILSMLDSKKESNVLEQFFEKGYLKYARFGNYRSPSEYIQQAIEEKRSFIYSSLPIKSNQFYLQNEVLLALRYADLSRICEWIDEQKNSTCVLSIFDEYQGHHFQPSTMTAAEAEKALEYIKRFIDLILKISVSSEYALPAIAYDEHYPPKTFEQFMEQILESKIHLKRIPFEQACWLLKEIKTNVLAKHKNINSRSEWLLCLNEKKDQYPEQQVSLAACLIHLCYNYTVEYSLYHVSKHYEKDDPVSFKADFLKRLKKECGDTDRFAKDPDWDLALRIVNKRKLEEEKLDRIELYENDYDKRRAHIKQQNQRLIYRLLLATLASIIPVFLYMWIDDTLNLLTDQVVSLMIANQIIQFFLLMIVGNLMSTIMDKIAKVSNLWEIISGITRAKKDLRQLSRIKESSFCNHDLHGLRYEQPQKRMKLLNQEDVRLTKYKRLWQERRQSFSANDLLPLVDPNTDADQLFAYAFDHQERIGIVHESPYYLHIVDLIQQTDPKAEEPYHPYERLLPAIPQGSIVAIVKLRDQFVLLKQFRHAIRSFQLSFIRGFGERNLSASENVKKEIMEEIGGRGCSAPLYLGTITGDSGVLGIQTAVYYAEIDDYEQQELHEGIKEICLMDQKELETAIKDQKIEDGFTLSAYLLYQQKLQTSFH